MSDLRPEEAWASACISAALSDLGVRQHDDGSKPGMFDLSLLRGSIVVGAVEVTAAADAESIELWALINPPGKRWVDPDLAGGWSVHLRPDARARRIHAELPKLVKMLEAQERPPDETRAPSNPA